MREPTSIPMMPWLFPQRPWSRIHLDYAGPTEGKMILVVVNAYSKWIDTAVVKSANTHTTIEELRKLFSIQGIPEFVVTDNAACFTSDEFQSFLKRNKVTHIRTPAYHPSSNGLAARAVQSCESWIEENDKWLNGEQTSSISANISSYTTQYYWSGTFRAVNE